MVNLLVLLLLTYHLRAIVDNLIEHNFVLADQIQYFWESGFLFDPKNYLSLVAGLTLLQFPMYAYIIEKLAGLGYLKDWMVLILVVAYLSCLLVYPVALI